MTTYIYPYSQSALVSALRCLHILFIFVTCSCISYADTERQESDKVIALIESSIHLKEDSSRAFAFANNAIELARKIGDSKILGRALFNMGSLLAGYDRYSSAITYFNSAILAYRTAGELGEIPHILRIVGRLYYSVGDYKKAMELYMDGLSMYEKLDVENADKGWLLRYIGSVYRRQKNYEEALEYYGRAMKIFKRFDDQDGIASCINNIGIVYGYQGKDSLQLQLYQKALKICEEYNGYRRASIILDNIGSIYSNNGEFDKAIACYNRASEYLRGLKLPDHSSIARNLTDISYLYIYKKEFEEAISYLQEAQEHLKKTEKKRKLRMKAIYSAYSTIYAEQGNYKKGLEYHKLYVALSDSLADMSHSSEVAQVEFRFRREIEELEIERLRLEQVIEDQKYQYQKYGLLFLFVLLSLVGVVFSQWRKLSLVYKELSAIIENSKEQPDTKGLA